MAETTSAVLDPASKDETLREQGARLTTRVDSFDGTADDAVEFARKYARTHADRIGVLLRETPDGAVFDTTNGTRVAYRASRKDRTDA